MSLELKGLFPAPVIPLDEELRLMEREFIVHIQRLARAGAEVGGVVVNGHAGEVTTLDREERVRVVKAAYEAAPVGFSVIAGVAALSTTEAIKLTQDAKDAGADAALIFPPFDYFPRRGAAKTVEAPLRFFSSIAEEVDFPIIIFQYPLWTGISYTTDTLLRLCEIENVVGIKNAVWDVSSYIEQYDALRGRVAVLAACDGPELLPMLAYGGDGALIGVSNVGTSLWSQFVNSCMENRVDSVRDLFFERLVPLAQALFGDIHIGAKSFNALTKEALVQQGLFSTSRVRPPELDVTDEDRKTVNEALTACGLLKG